MLAEDIMLYAVRHPDTGSNPNPYFVRAEGSYADVTGGDYYWDEVWDRPI